MIDDARALTADLKRLVTELEDDIRQRAGEDPATNERLHAEHEAAQAAERTAASFEEWRDGEITQAAVGWVLSTVFVRFLEDNRLIDDPLVGGVGDRLAAAKGRRDIYFDEHPSHSDCDHLQWCFRQVATFPAAAALFDEGHAAVWRLSPSADGAKAIREFFLRPDPQTGELVHDFTDLAHGTRFLGDLYQDLSEAAKKRYALLQTPEFVEEFILDRTLTPAIAEFGLSTVRLIDPTCGSGHFLIGALRRLFATRRDREPGTPPEQLVQTVLEQQVFGVDLNPYATAIARFRLVIEALNLAGIRRLADAPPIALNLATGDSLLHGPVSAVGRDGNLAGQLFEADIYRLGIEHAYATEDADAVRRILGQGYHAVVGNPPYIVGDNPAAREAYKDRYQYCHREFALTVPFMERFFELAAIHENDGRRTDAGFVGKITGNNFMKREFGVPLVERFLPKVDISLVIDTSGVDLPGHLTPTCIIFGRGRSPVSHSVEVADALAGDTAGAGSKGPGASWTALMSQLTRHEAESRYFRIGSVGRGDLFTHPMAVGRGRLLKQTLSQNAANTLASVIADMGDSGRTSLDDVMVRPTGSWRRSGLSHERFAPLVEGGTVRDWDIDPAGETWVPYKDGELLDAGVLGHDLSLLWPWRTNGWARRTFTKTSYREGGRSWYEWHQESLGRHSTPFSIAWAYVSSHTHFVLDRGGRIFKQTARIIKLPESAGEHEHLGVAGILNSSTSEFWLRQVCQERVQQGEAWRSRFDRDAGKVETIPLPDNRPSAIAAELDSLARERAALLDGLDALPTNTVLVDELARRRSREDELTARMVFAQEELDWQTLRAFGLVSDDLPLALGNGNALELTADFGIQLGERAFEVALARRVEACETETTWFDRHGSTPITELPASWPPGYRELVARRTALIAGDADIGMIEAPEHKRRWLRSPWAERERTALEALVLERLEAPDVWGDAPRLRAATELTDLVRTDPLLRQATEQIAGRPDADLGAVVAELLVESSVPFLAALRLKDSGLRKRAVWERVWEQQRYEDRIDAEVAAAGRTPDEAERRKTAEVGQIDVPPKYGIGDFRHPRVWSQRGKLDVPKERFFQVPGAERGADTSLVFGWAGWNERDRAVALAGRIYELREQEAADADRLTPLLAGIDELLPWITQWSPDDDPDYGGPPADYLEGWLDQQLAELGLTRDLLRGWRPKVATRGRRAAA